MVILLWLYYYGYIYLCLKSNPNVGGQHAFLPTPACIKQSSCSIYGKLLQPKS